MEGGRSVKVLSDEVQVMVPKHSERRHRLRGGELEPAKEAFRRDLLRRLDERDDLLATACLFRAWYRMEVYCRNKPAYPDHNTWAEISAYIGFGTVSRVEADEE